MLDEDAIVTADVTRRRVLDRSEHVCSRIAVAPEANVAVLNLLHRVVQCLEQLRFVQPSGHAVETLRDTAESVGGAILK